MAMSAMPGAGPKSWLNAPAAMSPRLALSPAATASAARSEASANLVMAPVTCSSGHIRERSARAADKCAASLARRKITIASSIGGGASSIASAAAIASSRIRSAQASSGDTRRSGRRSIKRRR
jgi:hypothetical protein